VLQDRVFERVGDAHTRSVDVRVIAATNSDLEQEVRAGRFREDLYWRLHVISLELPPLRERPGDIALLAETFVERFGKEYGRPLQAVEPECLARLSAFDWPGNVRQLENVIERCVLLAPGPLLRAGDLPGEILAHDPAPRPPVRIEVDSQPASPFMTLKRALEGPEQRIIASALERCAGHRQKAAAMLGINRTTLFNKMRKYGLLDASSSPAEASGR
jgi:DNA-binding NtrC family response regulator